MKLIEKDTPGQRIADLCKDYGISQIFLFSHYPFAFLQYI